MIFLLDVSCDSIALATFLIIMKRIVMIIQIVAPILLIVMLTKYFIHLISNPDDKKLPNKIKNSILALFIVFFVPVIVNAVMGLLGDSNSFSSCYNSVSGDQKISTSNTYLDDPDLTLELDNGFLTNPQEYEKGVTKDSSSSSSNTSSNYSSPSVSNFLSALEMISKQVEADSKSGNQWSYSNTNTRSTFSLAKTSTRSTNCALYVVWALVEVKALNPGQAFYKAYQNKKNYISWSTGAKEQLESVSSYIDGEGKTARSLAKEGKLLPGDIVLWYNHQHTNVYAGDGKFYDAGRSGTNGSGSLDNYKFTTLGPVTTAFYDIRVWKIIRLN